MRLKTFFAPNVSLAMARVRDALGENAFIVSTCEAHDGEDARVTAALETAISADMGSFAANDAARDPVDFISDVLDHHRLPPPVADPLRAAAGGFDGVGAAAMLAAALDIHYRFQPLDVVNCTGPLVFIGAPGAGKTVACAKTAAAALLAERPVRVINTDTDRAGTAERLKSLVGRLSLIVEDAPDDDTLGTCTAHTTDELVIVDTAGSNPHDENDFAALQRKLGVIRGDVMLVMAAGQDAFDAAEQATAFAAMGVNGMIAARLDTAFRYGGLLSAAKAGRVALSAAGVRPEIGDSLKPLNPMSLARLLLSRCDGSPSPLDVAEHTP